MNQNFLPQIEWRSFLKDEKENVGPSEQKNQIKPKIYTLIIFMPDQCYTNQTSWDYKAKWRIWIQKLLIIVLLPGKIITSIYLLLLRQTWTSSGWVRGKAFYFTSNMMSIFSKGARDLEHSNSNLQTSFQVWTTGLLWWSLGY